ncbi:hypothetical protein [Streptomyces sp. ACT015]|uniref:hypothetical protein n=1 Tax=Streptomyces sp. ACT015 TaxID=3134807 RepID=UPI003D16B01C
MTPEGETRRDRDGNPLWITTLSVRSAASRKADVVEVVTSGQPQGIEEGALVRVLNLWANDWEIDGRSGVTFKADALEPMTARAGGAALPPAPASSSSSAPASSGGRGKSGGDA